MRSDARLDRRAGHPLAGGGAIGGAVGWTLRSALQPNTSRRVTGRLEALATWIEALRDSSLPTGVCWRPSSRR